MHYFCTVPNWMRDLNRQIMEKNISTVIFDFGNVLIDLDIPAFDRNIQELTGLDTADVPGILGKSIAAYERGEISTELFINHIIRHSRRSIQAREIIQGWNSMLLGIRPEILTLLKILKVQYQTYILSNTNPLHIQWVHQHLLASHGVSDFEKNFLHGAFYSHQLKLSKPNPEVYKSVTDRLGVAPERILFLDDLEENVAGARLYGWNAIIHQPGTPLENSLRSFIRVPES